MILRIRNLRRQRQQGVAALELALLMPVLILLLMVPLFFGRYFWHYTVAHKAAHDAARYLSTVSVREMRSRPLAEAAGEIALRIADEEIADLDSGSDAPTIEVYCAPSRQCIGTGAGPLPQTVLVRVEMDMVDDIFGAVGTGFYGWRISAQAEMRYVGH